MRCQVDTYKHEMTDSKLVCIPAALQSRLHDLLAEKDDEEKQRVLQKMQRIVWQCAKVRWDDRQEALRLYQEKYGNIVSSARTSRAARTSRSSRRARRQSAANQRARDIEEQTRSHGRRRARQDNTNVQQDNARRRRTGSMTSSRDRRHEIEQQRTSTASDEVAGVAWQDDPPPDTG